MKHEARKLLERRGSREGGPECTPPGLLWIKDAFDRTGRVIHGDDWTGTELSALSALKRGAAVTDDAAASRGDRTWSFLRDGLAAGAIISVAAHSQSNDWREVKADQWRLPDAWDLLFSGTTTGRRIASVYWVLIHRASLVKCIAAVADGVSKIRKGEHQGKGFVGRPAGSGSYDDDPLIDEIHILIKNGDANSPTEAARLVADRAEGGGTPASKATRLRKTYLKKYPSKPL